MPTNNGKQSHIHPHSAVLSLRIEQWATPSLSFSPSLPLIREKRIFEKETEEKVSPSSRQKCTTNSFIAYTQTKKKHHVYFSRDGGESKRGVRSIHYTKVESAIESLFREKLLYIRVLVVKTNATPE
jgi:hypothetical protein